MSRLRVSAAALAPALFGVLAGVLVGACAPPLAPVELGGGNTARLAVTDEGLLAAIDSLTFTFFRNQVGQAPCAELIEMSPAQLAARGPVVAAPLARDETDAGHVFGSIRAGGRHSFLVLGLLDAPAPDDVALAEGRVIALGCEEVDVVQDRRSSIAVTLFPAGLR